ncbi:MAG TPA: 50S ribosomal protein L35 [Candidatus Paceibacterota bacterium]
MPKLKLKNSKSALKRFKFSGRGKISRLNVKLSHFNSRQDSNARRSKRGDKILSPDNKKDIKNLMPYI